MPKEVFHSAFSKLIVEINNNVVFPNAHNNYSANNITDGETNSIKICQILDGLEITISGIVKSEYEFEFIFRSFSNVIKPLRFELSNRGFGLKN